MASSPATALKRQHPEAEPDSAQKRPRVLNGSPAPQTNGTVTNGAKPDVSKIIAEARAKAAARAAQLTGAQPAANGLSTQPSTPGSASPAPSTNIQDRIAQIKARIAAAGPKATTPQSRPSPSAQAPFPPPSLDDGPSRGRGGLDVGLHPALLGDSGQDARSGKGKQAFQPKFATTMANRRTESPLPGKQADVKKQLDLSGPSIEETRNNPYFDPSFGSQSGTAKARTSRQLLFNQKGKYIQQATALRRQAALEEMKKRIAESSRRAGVTEDLDTEKAFLVPAPPDIEWWDEGLVAGSDYSKIDAPGGLKIDTGDSVITVFVQHPVPIEPPQEKKMPAPKPMFLTPQEQKKLRRQRRMADLKEQQAKVRLGLEPAPPPKVKRSNLMRVLGEEAVKDPTAVEARVNREIQARYDKHMAANEERKLKPEQRHEKLERQQAADAAKGILVSVYKIDSLANGRHRFKISKNAEQCALTGLCILNPKFCLVIVEGGQHSINFYKKLMLNRVDWTENSGPNSVREGNNDATAAWLQAEDEKGNLKDLGLNSCQLVWEGEEKARAFKNWRSRVCETDKDARDTLARAKMDNFWTLAKSMSSS